QHDGGDPQQRRQHRLERATLGMALGMARGEAVLTALLWIAAIVLWQGAGVIDPEARLWALFMVVQSLPFAAAVLISMVNAAEQMRHARSVFETAAAPAVATAAMQPAQ